MSSATAQQQHTYLVDEETIRSLYTEFEAAFRKGDLDGMLSSISDCAIFAWDQIEIIGCDALKQAFVESLATV